MRNALLLSGLLLLSSCSENEQAAENASEDILAADNLSGQAATPRFPCAAIENLLATQSDCADLTALADDVRPGDAALDAPATMTRGKLYEVTLVIDRKEKEAPPPPPPPPEPDPAGDNAMVDEVSDNMAYSVGDETEPQASPPGSPSANAVVADLPGVDTPFEAQVGRYMTATLIGSGFTITLIEPADPMQVIPIGGQGRWQWEVEPRQGGARRLTVKTQAVGIVDGKPIALGNGASSQAIFVDVSWPDRIWDALVAAPRWLQAIAAVFVALAALIAAVRPVRRAVFAMVRRRPRKDE